MRRLQYLASESPRLHRNGENPLSMIRRAQMLHQCLHPMLHGRAHHLARRICLLERLAPEKLQGEREKHRDSQRLLLHLLEMRRQGRGQSEERAL